METMVIIIHHCFVVLLIPCAVTLWFSSSLIFVWLSFCPLTQLQRLSISHLLFYSTLSIKQHKRKVEKDLLSLLSFLATAFLSSSFLSCDWLHVLNIPFCFHLCPFNSDPSVPNLTFHTFFDIKGRHLSLLFCSSSMELHRCYYSWFLLSALFITVAFCDPDGTQLVFNCLFLFFYPYAKL